MLQRPRMTAMPSDADAPRLYTGSQIALHWIIAVLILCQYLFAESMEEAWRAWRREGVAEGSAGATAHMVFGLTILALAALRLFIRFKRGAPPVPAGHPLVMRLLANATHFTLYVLLFVLPLSGAAAWFGGIGGAALVHVLAKNVLLAFLGLHVLGAVGELFYAFRPATRQMITFGTVR